MPEDNGIVSSKFLPAVVQKLVDRKPTQLGTVDLLIPDHEETASVRGRDPRKVFPAVNRVIVMKLSSGFGPPFDELVAEFRALSAVVRRRNQRSIQIPIVEVCSEQGR